LHRGSDILIHHYLHHYHLILLHSSPSELPPPPLPSDSPSRLPPVHMTTCTRPHGHIHIHIHIHIHTNIASHPTPFQRADPQTHAHASGRRTAGHDEGLELPRPLQAASVSAGRRSWRGGLDLNARVRFHRPPMLLLMPVAAVA
jgi:hypothetical protein